MSKRSIYVRVDSKTKRAVKLLVARRQMETAANVSENAALWAFIEEHDPEIARRALKHEVSDSKGDDGDDIA